MKINELSVGQIVQAKAGMAVILDIARAHGVNVGVVHTVNVKGAAFTTNGWWYKIDPEQVATRRVVLGVIGNDLSMGLAFETAATISYVYPDDNETMRQRIAQAMTRNDLDLERSRRRERAEEAAKVVSEVVYKVLGIDQNQNQRSYGAASWDRPWSAFLNNKDLLAQMTMLWLRYHEQQGLPVGGDDQPGALAEQLREALRAAKYTEQTAKMRDDLIIEQAKTHLEANWTNKLVVTSS